MGLENNQTLWRRNVKYEAGSEKKQHGANTKPREGITKTSQKAWILSIMPRISNVIRGASEKC